MACQREDAQIRRAAAAFTKVDAGRTDRPLLVRVFIAQHDCGHEAGEPMRGSMQYLGVLRGAGTLSCGDEPMGRAEFDIDGFMTRPGEVVASGEIRMAPDDLTRAFGRTGLQLQTDDGRVLDVRFSGKRLDPSDGAAHADITGQLPPAKEWRR